MVPRSTSGATSGHSPLSESEVLAVAALAVVDVVSAEDVVVGAAVLVVVSIGTDRGGRAEESVEGEGAPAQETRAHRMRAGHLMVGRSIVIGLR